jgi:hypothetical protein
VRDTGEWGTYVRSQFVLGVPGIRIAGGIDEVIRNISGERVLGLSRDLNRPGCRLGIATAFGAASGPGYRALCYQRT